MAACLAVVPLLFLLGTSFLHEQVVAGRNILQVFPFANNPLCGVNCRAHEGTVLIPGLGRYFVGQHPQLPDIGRTFLGDSIGAAMRARFIPGSDDSVVPNPGYEIPNPVARSAPPVP